MLLGLRWALHRMRLRLRLRWRGRHVRNGLRRELRRQRCSGRLWWGDGVAPGRVTLRLVSEGSGSRAPALFVHVWLHLVRVRMRVLLWLRVGILRVRLWQAMGDIRGHVVGVLRVVHGRLRHVCEPVHWLRHGRPDRLARHVGPHPLHVVS